MEERYAVTLNGRKVGTVRLDPTVRGVVRARLAPLPVFRSIAKHRRTVAAVAEWEIREDDLTPAELAAVDGAEAVLGALRFELANDSDGKAVRTQRIQLLRGDPPHLRIEW